MHYDLSVSQIEAAIDFARRYVETQELQEFVEPTARVRSPEEGMRDTLIGKLAEFGFADVVTRATGIAVNVDCEVYGRRQGDTADIIVNGWRVEMKAARTGAEWLLVGENQLARKEHNRVHPHVYVLCVVGWSREHDRPDGFLTFAGYALRTEIKALTVGTIRVERGSCIPGKATELQESNLARHRSTLHGDWDRLFRAMVDRTPKKE